MPDELTVVTWNLQGSSGLDVDLVVDTIGPLAPDVLVLQEVQRVQCRRLAARLGWSSEWAFKHWPIVSRAEGMAVLTPHRLGRVDRFVLHHSWPWSWRRRIAIDASVVVGARPWRVMNVHLSPHDLSEHRHEEAAAIIDRSRLVPPVVVGDFNERPGGAVHETLAANGWFDAWDPDGESSGAGSDDADPGATNWTEGDRTGRPPTQRLDAVFVPVAWTVERVVLVDQPLAALAAMTDHLPLAVTVVRGVS